MKKIMRGKPAVLVLFAILSGIWLHAGVNLKVLAIPKLFAETHAAESAARFEPSSPAIVLEMLNMAGVSKHDLVYDLGSGDGRIVITAARTTGARGIGVDIDPDLIRQSRKNAEQAAVRHLVQFREEDLFKTDISNASVVMLYLSPDANLKLRPKLLSELKPGSRIVSHFHRMGDWEPDTESQIENHYVYLWIVPADVSGRWKLDVADKYAGSDSSIEFEQSYQKIDAAVKAGEAQMPVTAADLQGKKLQFSIEREFGSLAPPVHFTGEVDGDRISGKFRCATHSGNWTAKRMK